MSVNVQKGSDAPAVNEYFAGTYTVPRVNLMPPEIEAERGFKKTQLGLGAVALAVAGLVVGGFVWAQASANEAEEGLANEQARTSQLSTEQAKYAEVPQVLGQVDAAKAAQANAMVTDVLWFDYLDHIAASYPKDVWLRDLTVSVAAPSTAAVAAPGTAVVVPTTPTIGTITFNGTTTVHGGTANWLDVMAATPGLADPLYSTSSRNELDGTVVVDFTSTVNVTPDALSDRFEIKAS
jgi:Tfp pilus assembly protein PilN